jgi:hypothetical protein
MMQGEVFVLRIVRVAEKAWLEYRKWVEALVRAAGRAS